MKTPAKHFKFINNSTGYAIYYYSVDAENITETDLKAELEKVRAQVASSNGLLLNTVYWEPVRDELTQEGD